MTIFFREFTAERFPHWNPFYGQGLSLSKYLTRNNLKFFIRFYFYPLVMTQIIPVLFYSTRLCLKEPIALLSPKCCAEEIINTLVLHIRYWKRKNEASWEFQVSKQNPGLFNFKIRSSTLIQILSSLKCQHLSLSHNMQLNTLIISLFRRRSEKHSPAIFHVLVAAVCHHVREWFAVKNITC